MLHSDRRHRGSCDTAWGGNVPPQLFSQKQGQEAGVSRGDGSGARDSSKTLRDLSFTSPLEDLALIWAHYSHLLPQGTKAKPCEQTCRGRSKDTAHGKMEESNSHHFVCPFFLLVAGIRWTKMLFHNHNVGLRNF